MGYPQFDIYPQVGILELLEAASKRGHSQKKL